MFFPVVGELFFFSKNGLIDFYITLLVSIIFDVHFEFFSRESEVFSHMLSYFGGEISTAYMTVNSKFILHFMRYIYITYTSISYIHCSIHYRDLPYCFI